MAERRISMIVHIDLAKASKEAHAVTIEKLAKQVGTYAADLIEDHGYTIRKAHVETVMHYVRHELHSNIRTVKRALRKVS